ncbi:hypothetical protein SLS63_006608 [Diaporthe eres]|uniref:Flavodoxin-like domain-containing protein n=1 Tax=Diaporthe eres TaxID=83184 RepID=A0ABR1P7U3_DIAER
MDTRLNSFYKDNLHPFIGAMTNVLIESGNRSGRPGWLTALYRNTNRRFDEDNKTLHQVAREVVERRRRVGQSEKKDLLDAMLNGRDPATGKSLTDQTITDNMITFLMAGHETTACLLGFFFALVVQNPEAYENVQKEVDSVVGQRPITADDVSRLPYIKACLREALRLYPPSAGFSLTPTSDDMTDGPAILGGKWPIKRKQAIFIVLPGVHRDPNVWGPDADEFRPERMLDENFKKLPPGCYKPFGNGQGACIGSEFAMQESILAAAMLFQKFDFDFVDPEYKLTVKQTLTLKPRDLFIHAKLRPGIDVLTLQRDMVHGPSGSKPVAASHEHSRDALGDAPIGLKPLSIFYGSNTGTCHGLADWLAMTAPQRGFQATVLPLDEAEGNLPKDRPVVLITSTMYEGQAPDNGAKFVEWLEDEDNTCLDGVNYAVFGCGSRDWKDTFQRIAIIVDKLMQMKGAEALAPRGVADVTEGNILADFDAWQADYLWPGISKAYATSVVGTTTKDLIDMTQFPAHIAKDNAHAFDAKIVEVAALTAPEDGPKYHMEIQIPTTIQYNVGDYLEVYPKNSSEDLESLRDVLQAQGHDLADPLVSAVHTRLELHQQASSKPRFSPPAEPIATPTIMICAGAGLAPFRGFAQDRAERLRQNPDLASKVAPALLYIGCRGPEHALYAAELQGWQDSGAVEIRYAYSRQGARPDDHLGYVQDRVWADRDELVRIWENGAKVYVCGSRAVSHGVRDVVQRIYREQAEKRCGSKTDAEVEGWWVEILRDRYAADVF